MNRFPIAAYAVAAALATAALAPETSSALSLNSAGVRVAPVVNRGQTYSLPSHVVHLHGPPQRPNAGLRQGSIYT
jgi:hypothetical protein